MDGEQRHRYHLDRTSFRPTSPPNPKEHLHPQPPAHRFAQPPPLPLAPPVGRAAFGLGVAAVALGLVAASFIWVSFCGLAAFPIAAIGLALAGAGVIVSLASGPRRQPVRMPLIGAVVCAASIVVGVVATRARQESPEVIAQRNALWEKDRLAREAREAREAAERAAAPLGTYWTPRPPGLPAFTVVSDDYATAGFKNSAHRTTEITASGDLTAANLATILDYAAGQYPIPQAVIHISAIDPRPGAAGGRRVATRSDGANTIDASAIRAYRREIGLDPPATAPATAPVAAAARLSAPEP